MQSNINPIQTTFDAEAGVAGPSKSKDSPAGLPYPDSDEEDDERPDTAALKALSKQIQRAPQSSGSSGPKRVVIPRRGEKDFEPLDVTINIQEKMLRESRQALFDGLQGVRGTSNKHMSHAILPFGAVYPKVVINRGSLLTTMGHSIRSAAPAQSNFSQSTDKGKQRQITEIELLPEEALYLLERGSMQIWVQYKHFSSRDSGSLEWDDEIEGFGGCIGMSTLDAFDRFIGMEGLTLERYRAYAGLKRLGYTVHRTAQFLPKRFRKDENAPGRAPRTLEPSRSAVAPFLSHSLKSWQKSSTAVMRAIGIHLDGVFGHIIGLVLGVGARRRRRTGTLLDNWTGTSYGALYQKLRIIPRSHPTAPVKAEGPPADASLPNEDIYAPLEANPYLPFFHVWKPNTHWTRSKWDKASPEGILAQQPAFYVGIVDARSTTFPTLDMLESIFEELPHQDPPRVRPRPGYSAQGGAPGPESGLLARIWGSLFGSKGAEAVKGPPINTFAALKQGDRTLVTAVNDGGNIGWMRFGRGTFEDHDMVTLP